MRRTGKVIGTLAAATSLALIGGGPALADQIRDSIDGEGNNALVLIPGDPDSTAEVTITVTERNGDGENGCNIDDGATLTLALLAPTGVIVDPSPLEFQACGSRTITVSANEGATAGSITATYPQSAGGVSTETGGSYDVNVSIPVRLDTDGDGVHDGRDNCPDDVNANQSDVDADGIGDACEELVAPSNAAPTVSDAADDAIGTEGATLTTEGAFADADASDILTITKLSGAGVVTASTVERGGWSWSLPTSDNGGGTVVVQVSDGNATETDTFDWVASNVAPTVTALTQDRTGTCSVTVGATYTDPGTADTHVTSVLWADGNTDLARTFTSAGSYNGTIYVTDDDGGEGGLPFTGVRAYNTPSSILAPINTSGTRSSFKIGSTVPVKITVMGCDGNAATGLTPTVNVALLDLQAETPVNESLVTEVATNGKVMRWSTDQYVYNLSTKLSQFTGATLASGTHMIQVSDPSFQKSVNAQFDARK